MVKRPTWILLAVLVLVAGAYFLLQRYPLKGSETTPTATASAYLVTDADGTLQSIQIRDTAGATFRMQRDLSNNWVITAPTSGAADQSQASAAETQAKALLIVSTLDTPPDLSSIQLNQPADVIELTFNNGGQHKIEVGGVTPTGSGYYVRFDGKKIYVVSQYGIDALLNLLKSPPFPPTATPAETATPEITITPESATPTP